MAISESVVSRTINICRYPRGVLGDIVDLQFLLDPVTKTPMNDPFLLTYVRTNSNADGEPDSTGTLVRTRLTRLSWGRNFEVGFNSDLGSNAFTGRVARLQLGSSRLRFGKSGSNSQRTRLIPNWNQRCLSRRLLPGGKCLELGSKKVRARLELVICGGRRLELGLNSVGIRPQVRT